MKKNGRINFLISFIVFLLGIVLTLIMFGFAVNRENTRMKQIFDQRSKVRMMFFWKGLGDSISDIKKLQIFFNSSDSVDKKDFVNFSEILLKDSIACQALLWIPEVSGKDREKFETDGRALEIRDKKNDGTFMKSPTRITYFPVLYCVSQSITKLYGRDLSSFIGQASDQHIFTQFHDDSFIYLFPAQMNSKDKPFTKGFVGGIINLQQLYSNILKFFPPGQIDTYVFCSGKLVYYHPSRSSASPGCPVADNVQGVFDSLKFKQYYERQEGPGNLEIISIPAQIFFQQGGKWIKWAIIIVGLFFSIMVSSYIFYILDRKLRLQQSSSELKTILDTMSNILIVVNPDRSIKLVNRAFVNTLGFRENEIVGKNLKYVFYNPDSNKLQSMLNMISSAPIKSLEEEFATKKGEKVNVSINASLMSGNAKTSETEKLPPESLIVIVAQDLRDRLRLEGERNKLQKLESLGILAGGIAHDFNNLLAVIIGNISMAKMYQEKNTPARNFIDEAEKGAERAKSLTVQLLTFSKGGEPVKTVIDFSRLISDSVNFSLHGANVRADYKIASDLSSIEADESQINRVIQNIVINAVQSMPDGGVITVSARNIDLGDALSSYPGLKPGKYVELDISDNGKGISEENIAKIFEPYFTTKKNGSGLGLSTSFSIVVKHGGHIFVNSEEDKGSTFTVCLPASDKEPPPKIETVTTKLKTIRRRVLVMDDDPMIRNMFSKMLKTLGWKIDCASDGDEALGIFKSALADGNPFDLVILDLTIPGGMGGKETMANLIKITPSVNAIISSGYSEDSTSAHYSKLGFKAVIAKPFTFDEIKKTLYEVLEKKK